MRSGNPWSVKGIQPATRQAAKEAARRQGLTLGQWLNHVILDSSDEHEEAFDDQRRAYPQQKPATPQLAATAGSNSLHLQDKIDDIAARLDTIYDKKPNPVDLDQWETENGRSSGWSDLAVRTISREEGLHPAKQHQSERAHEAERKSEVFEERFSALADRLDNIVEAREATKSHSDQSLTDLEANLRKVVSHIEVSDRQNADVLKSIQARLSELSSRTSASNNDTVQKLAGTVSKMEGHLSHLSQRVSQTETSAGEILSFEEQIKGLTDQLDSSLNRPADPKISALEEQANQLSAQFEDFLLASGDTNAADQYEKRLNDISDQLKATEQQFIRLSSLEDSINQLFEAVEQDRNTARDNTFNTSKKAIKTMETMVDQAAQKAAENAAQRSAQHVAAIMADDGLNKKEVTASVASLRDEVRNLQETTLTAARRCAEEAVSAGLNGQTTNEIAEPMMALRQQFDRFQDTSRSTELQNQDTLEAVHDTLEKVVGRLTTLETSPLKRPADEFQSDVWDSFEADPDVDDQPVQYDASSPSKQGQRIDPTFDKPVEDEDVPDKKADGNGPALNQNYLEAARRAAQAASLMPKNRPDAGEELNAFTGKKPPAKSNFLAMATQSGKRRKTMLLAVAAVLLVIGALSAARLIGDRSPVAVNTSASAPAVTIPKNKLTNTTSPKNEPNPEDATVGSPEIAEPAISPVSQNTSRAPDINSPVPPKIVTSAATLNELTGTRQEEKPQNPVKVVRLNAAAASQSSILNDASRSQPAGPLPPEAIGPDALRREAAAGNAVAQFEIADRYTAGKLVPQDFGKAIFWYQKAAAQSLAPAQYILGTFYEKGRGVAKDNAAARIWYERAAIKGNLKAIHNLAVIYADGSNGNPDFTKAGLWFRKAAELGLADSQFNLAILHDRGLGVSKDPSKAYFWFQIAAKQGDRDAGARADIIEKRMAADEIAQTKLLISNWSPVALSQKANEVALPAGGWQRPLSAAQTATVSSFTQRQLVILAQGYLTRLGFNPGPADGVLGTQTRAAIENFQQQHQLPVSGNVNSILLSKMKDAIG